MMLLVLHAPPPMLKLDEPQVFPEGETTPTCCSQAALLAGLGSTAYPLPPWTMCSAVFGREASQSGGGDIDVDCASNCPSHAGWFGALKPARNRPLPTRS